MSKIRENSDRNVFEKGLGRKGGGYGRQSDNDLSDKQSDICIIVALLRMSH
jgi:hypothetical protein